MTNNEDMSGRNYNKVRVVEEGNKINWVAIYLECIWKRATNALKKGGSTMVHAYLKALALVAPLDPKAKRSKTMQKKSQTEVAREG